MGVSLRRLGASQAQFCYELNFGVNYAKGGPAANVPYSIHSYPWRALNVLQACPESTDQGFCLALDLQTRTMLTGDEKTRTRNTKHKTLCI